MALRRLIELSKSREGHVAVKALSITSAYGFCRPAQRVELAETESSHAYVFHYNYPVNPRHALIEPNKNKDGTPSQLLRLPQDRAG
jgi:hypothetical protein